MAVAVPALNCLKAIAAAPPTGSVATLVIIWGVFLAAFWVGSILLAMHNEHDIWGTLISGLGTPTLFISLLALPQLATS